MKELWKLIRSCTFSDGRLLRIGGDSRARYCYCQDYALPMWALIEDFFDEDCSELEIGWLKILKKETDVNGDGSVNLLDVSHYLKYIAGWKNIYTDIHQMDLDRDGNGNISDVTVLLKHIAGWNITLG